MKTLYTLILLCFFSFAKSQTKVYSIFLDSLCKATGKQVRGFSKTIFKNKDNTFRETLIIFYEEKKEMKDSILNAKYLLQ